MVVIWVKYDDSESQLPSRGGSISIRTFNHNSSLIKIHVNVTLVYTDQGPYQRRETRKSAAEGVNIWLIFAYVLPPDF